MRLKCLHKAMLICMGLAAALACAPALAQTSSSPGNPAPDDSATIQTLLKKIAELEAGQKQMQQTIDKLSGPASTASRESAPSPSPAVPATNTQGQADDTQDAAEAHVLGPIQFQGFSDFNYGRAWFEKLPPNGLAHSPESFNIGDFDLFANVRISEHWSMLGELLITSDFSNEFSAELDRLMLTYRANDYFKISFGKFDTALGYYTNQFHRAQYFQYGIGRPIMYSDEDNGGILPVHNIGVSATGKIPSGTLGLHWVAEVANGRSPGDIPVQNFVDENNGKAVDGALYIRPDWLRGLQSGFSVYHDTYHLSGLNAIGENIYTAHIAYMGARFEWLNEAAVVRHAVHGTGETYNLTTAYSEVSLAFGKNRPYFRYDFQNVPEADPIFGTLGRLNGPSVGFTRHLSNYVAFKIQYGRLSQRQLPATNGFTTQLAFAF
ncbi:MAG TPA: hypothetical protein VML19_27850 [Verrucomicrobiae bacterium]|nr:hypothetical protein [Verrucomicrobiae bacterium]